MAQAGIHGLVGLTVKRWAPERRWLMMGIVLGNLAPDLDNVAVAVASITGDNTGGLHRTFTHSLFTMAAIIVLGAIAAGITKQSKWRNLGIGLGIGIVLHVLLDLLIWFNGVQILWPLPLWLNLWGNVQLPEWWHQLMMPAEFLAFFLYFWGLGLMARQSQTDASFLGKLRFLSVLIGALFVLFAILIFVMGKGFTIIYGATYLLALTLAIGVTIRMRDTIETSMETVGSVTSYQHRHS